MNCMKCGAPLNKSQYCPQCGFDVRVQKKIWQLSNLYYNQGLEKAEIRDLSGAIDLLKRSLKFNKLNVPARNLLGLVYFETGEAVAALSEWVISKNIMPENNIASEYIDLLQENANKLDVINQTIKKYNECLKCCRRGSEDIAVIQLKKILSQNPKLIKGYHLLALIYIKDEEYEKARKILKKAAKIDKTNSTTLRFLKEVDEQTGTVTRLEGNHWLLRGKDKGDGSLLPVNADVIVHAPTFRESSMVATLLNLGFGFLVGAFLVWFLVVPANTQRVNREANEKVVSYSNTMASQSAELKKLEEKIAESEATVSSAQEQIAQADVQVTTYENLIKAHAAYQEGNYTAASKVLQNVQPELLSVDAKEIYDRVYQNVRNTLITNLKTEGEDAFYDGQYAVAMEKLNQLLTMDATNYEAMNIIAHCYRLQGDYENAVIWFQKIIDTFPDTQKAVSAQRYVDNGGRTLGDDEDSGSDDSGEGTFEEGEEDSPNEDEDEGEDTGETLEEGSSEEDTENE